MVQTIERTGKTWKGFKAVGAIVVLLGICACLAADRSDGSDAGIIIASIGIALYAAGRMGAWWHHG